jgi:hypothetical protein
VTLAGSVVREEQGRLIAVSMESLLPARNELDVTTPILVRDGKQVVASEPSAGTRIDCTQGRHKDCGIGLYGPGQGGWAAMGQLHFQEDGHSYLLYSGLPIAGGEQPRPVWIVHFRDYLPSKHGGSKSDDSLYALSSGEVSGLLR